MLPVWYKDADNDGWADGSVSSVTSCLAPSAEYKRAPDYNGDGVWTSGVELKSLEFFDCNDNDANTCPDCLNDCNPASEDQSSPQPYEIQIASMTVNNQTKDYGAWRPNLADRLKITFKVVNGTGDELSSVINVNDEKLEGNIIFPPADVVMTNYPGKFYNDIDTEISSDFDELDLTAIANQVSFRLQDYGGVIALKATATVIINASTSTPTSIYIDKVFSFPKDSDGDKMPDFWENQFGNLAPEADTDRDGIPNVQEYRGVKWGLLEKVDPDPLNMNTSNSHELKTLFNTAAYVPVTRPGGVAEHTRTNPLKRTLFIKFAGYKDGANSLLPQFAIGEAFARLANPVEIYALSQNAFLTDTTISENNIDVAPVDYAEMTYGNENGNIWKRSIRDWSFSTLGASGFGNETEYASVCLVYRRAMEPLFGGNRPYSDNRAFFHGTKDNQKKDPSYWTITDAPNGILDPLSRVEDANDNGILDSIENKVDLWFESQTPTLTGDYLVPCRSPECEPDPKMEGWVDNYWDMRGDLSPFDIDNDRKTELPLIAEVPSGGYVNATGEYTIEQGVKHVTTHELGHAIGVSIHTTDSACVMYDATNNFMRDNYFSPTAAEKIRIHNKPDF
jgi:hypothetical protein